MEKVLQKQNKSFLSLKEQFGYKNKLQAPQIKKVVVGSGVGSLKDKRRVETIRGRIAEITGQKPSVKAAKKSIASFKVREGDPSGLQVTLRGARMFDFLDRLLNIALPRTRDFRGINRSVVDQMGNATIGIKEHTIFPETADEDLANVFGLAITIVTSAKSKKEAEAFLELIGVPFKKVVEGEKKVPKRKK